MKRFIMQIRHLPHNKINFALWDQCIACAGNSLVYAFSWYLDVVSPGWEALVADDYKYIMPLPVKRKFGLKYIVQPVLTQQLGVFSKEPVDSEIVDSFIRSIPCLSYEMNLNESNFTEKAEKLPNLLIDLNVSYEYLRSKFSVNTKRNITKSEQYQLSIDWNFAVDEFIRLYSQNERNFTATNKETIKELIHKGKENHSISICCVRTPELAVISALCLLHSGNRIIYLLPFSTRKGKEYSAMFFLVNEIIKKYADTENMLDFEGSKIEGVYRFYKGFGAGLRSYYLIKRFRPELLKGRL